MTKPVTERPKDWKQNFGGWFWAYLVAMLIWSAISASQGSDAMRQGQIVYGLAQWLVAGSGMLCLIGWYRTQDQEPVKGDRLTRFPELVLGVFDAFCFGGGAGATAIHRAAIDSPEASPWEWVLGAIMIWIGVTFIRRAIVRYRWLNRPTLKGEEDGQES